MRAFVISLPRRADRLKSFMDHVVATRLNTVFDFDPVAAVDGIALDVTELQPRIARPYSSNLHARSVMNLEAREIRGMLGCALSHLEVWRRVSELGEPAAVFEDDARLGPDIDVAMVASALEKVPKRADLCWLNDCHYGARGGFRFRLRRKLTRYLGPLPSPTRVSFTPMPDIMVATDAYILTADFAGRLWQELMNSLGAVDRHMQLFIAHNNSRVYQSYPPLFTTDFTDSDTSPRQNVP